jgi:DNA-binding NarL/FixJ family response regulator
VVIVEVRVKVVLIDDHQLFREGLALLLGTFPQVELVGSGSSAREGCALVERVAPDVVILDVTLPDGDGIATTREVLRRRPKTQVLMLTMHATEFFVRKALEAGARGYALKSQSPTELHRALDTVMAGNVYLAPEITMSSDRPAPRAGEPSSSGGSNPLDELSPREREVFDLVMRGLSNHEIARNLCISIKTVETHRTHINRKLGVHSTGQLIRLAALQGLVQ